MSKRVEMQHYVPRVYLRNFGIDPTEDNSIVQCYDKTAQRQFPASIKKIGGENDFYDIPEDPDQEFESKLCTLEGEFGQAYESIIDLERVDNLNGRDQTVIGHTIAVQLLRTLEERKQLRELVSGVREKIETDSEIASSESDSEQDAGEDEGAKLRQDLRELDTDEGITRLQRDTIRGSAGKLTEIILNMNWVLYTNDTGDPFWTSDHPIVRANNITRGPYGNLGLMSAGIEVYFPLSPRLTLACFDPEHEVLGQLSSKSVVNSDHVRYQNALQVQHSTRHLISNTADFALADEVLTDHPELGNLNRDRSSLS